MINNECQESQSFEIPSSFSPMPLADCLRRLGVSLTLRRRVKHHGVVHIDGFPAPWNTLVYPNSTIRLEWNIASNITAEDIPLRIVYEDECLLVVDKPAGMLIHPTPYCPGGTLANAVIHTKGITHAFHPVQRLDKNTSGLLIVAKLSSVHHALNQQHLQRIYMAVAEGNLQPTEGILNFPIARDPNSIILRRVHSSGQPAITQYQVLRSFSSASLLQLQLQTGRTHQIRLHLSHIGHPLLGDDLYGGNTKLIKRQALHSFFLEFRHPNTGVSLSFTSNVPEDIEKLLASLQPS
jgi:23S rRNA pseudouridine1911/1915/1917 synthase